MANAASRPASLHWGAALAALLVAWAGAAGAQPAGDAAETDIKTAFVYNFIALSTWPAEVGPVLRLCVAGPPEKSATLRVLAGKVAGQRTISVAFVHSTEAAADCQALYIPSIESPRLGTWLAAVAGKPTLTISERAGPGAIINLRLMGARVIFDVDTGAAAAARIGLSSQLIKLAAARR